MIKNGLIVTMNSERKHISDGAVVIKDRRIVDVGKTYEIARKYRSDKIIDAKNHLVTPGCSTTTATTPSASRGGSSMTAPS